MQDEELYDHHGAMLTRRQRQVLRLQAYGLTHQEIADHLGLSIWTVKNHHKQAVRTLATSLRSVPRERVRTSLACYILGLLDGGWTPRDVAKHLKQVSPPPSNGTRATDTLASLEDIDDDLAPAAS
jgi:DNA-binding CsgD family transcriptional regulator